MSKSNKLISDQSVAEVLQFLQTSQNFVAASRAARIRAEFNRECKLAMPMLRSSESSPEMHRAWAIARVDYAAVCEQEAQAVEADEWNRAKMNNAQLILETWKTEKIAD